eukprot:4521509-Prymnesium_polylepis.1
MATLRTSRPSIAASPSRRRRAARRRAARATATAWRARSTAWMRWGWATGAATRRWADAAVSYTHLTLPTICSV